MNIEMLIEKYQLNESETQVLRFMDGHQASLKKMGIREVAKQSYVSTATVINMSKKIGFSGYSELVFSFSNGPTSLLTSEIVSDKERQQFLQLLTKYQEKRIMVLGSGFSQNIANYFSEFLNLYKFRATANSHLEFLRESLDEKILIIIISNSGDTVRLMELALLANEHQIDTIAFVGEKNSKIGRLATLTISTESYSPQVFHDFSPNLFFGTALNQFELLMSDTLKSIFN